MSFYTALTGLKGAQTDISTTSNNIANVGSNGFKKSRAEFGDIFGSTPLQAKSVGVGTLTKSITQQFSQGNIAASSNSLDMAISGHNLGGEKITKYCKTSNPKINKPCSLAGKTIKEQDGSIELAMNRKNQQQLRDSGTSITVTNQYVQNYIPNFKTERWDGVEITSHGYISEVAKRIKDYTCIT